ncbi:MAG: SBBP repeat-containing protein, partial [Planctomycetes bacterium]|nr:SBBP repeat-containing protein [Planctomycetota bacterium]
MVSAFPGLALVLFGVTMLAAPAQDQTPEKHGSPPAPWAALPVYFVENRGVFADRVAYYVEGCGRTLFFERTGITIRLTGPEQAWIVKLVFVGSSPDVVPAGERPQPAVFSYFHGQRDRWKAGLGSFARVVYHNLWPGIDLAYQGTGNKLKYEFTVHPGADPARIQLRYEGAAPARITEEGALRVETPVGFLEDAPPIAWQDIGGRRVPVGMGYSLSPGGLWGFAPGKYDPTKTLVLDPAILVYCGYLGGTGDDESYGIAVDAAGNAYVTGKTTSTEQTFPVQAGPDLHYNGGLTDAFVA